MKMANVWRQFVVITYRTVNNIAEEKTYENKIKKYLTNKGAWILKTFGNGFQRSGVPDLICCLNGVFIAIEVKASNGKPSQLQLYNIDKIRKSGGVAMVLYPNQWEQFKEYIESEAYYAEDWRD